MNAIAIALYAISMAALAFALALTRRKAAERTRMLDDSCMTTSHLIDKTRSLEEQVRVYRTVLEDICDTSLSGESSRRIARAALGRRQ